MESRSAVHPGSNPNAYTPYDAALSDEPCATSRTSVRFVRLASEATSANSDSCESRRRSAAGCSRISSSSAAPGGSSARGSGSDKVFAPNEHAVDLEVVVEHDDVGAHAALDPSDLELADDPGRDRRRRGERVRERHAERVQIPDRLQHRQHASREHVLRAARAAASNLDLDVAQAVAAVTLPRTRHRIGDEREPARGGAPDEQRSFVRNVVPIEDQLDDHVVAHEGRPRDARVAVPEGPHRVEQVRDGECTAVERGLGFLRRRIGVAAGNGDAAREQQVDQLERAGKLGCERDEALGSRVEQPLEQVRAHARGGEEWPLDVHTEDPRTARLGRDLAERRDEHGLGRRDQGREVGGDAGLEQRLACALVTCRVRGREVDAAEAVDLQVHEPRCRDPAPAVAAANAVAGDAALTNLDVARNELPVDERSFDAESHRRAPRTLSSDDLRRSRAAAASTPASSETIATFALPPAALSASSACRSSAPVATRTIERTRSRSFSFDAATSTIRLPYVFPSRIIETVESVLSTSFCAVPALSRVDPATSSGPTTTSIARSASAASSDPGAQTSATVRAPAARAARTASTTYGVRPLALIPTTTSLGLGASRSSSRAPAAPSSSAASCSRADAALPPATRATIRSAGMENVDSHSAASTAASRPEVPAPTYTRRPPPGIRSTISSTTAAMASPAAATAQGTVASCALISETSSADERRSRSAWSVRAASVTRTVGVASSSQTRSHTSSESGVAR